MLQQPGLACADVAQCSVMTVSHDSNGDARGDGGSRSSGGVLASTHASLTAAPAATALTWYEPTRSNAVAQSDYADAIPQSWSYSVLWWAAVKAANNLRAILRRERHVTGARIGVAIAEGVMLPLVELAILLAGAAVVPLDLEEPSARLQLLLEDAKLAAAVIRDEDTTLRLVPAHCSESVEAIPVSMLLPNGLEEAEMMAKETPLPELPACLPEGADVSHVFFTSGSTGRPKGCVCTHDNLLAYCIAKNDVHKVSGQSIVFSASAHTFDPSIGDFFATWAAGACLALAPKATLSSVLGLCLRAMHATHLLATPALFASLAVAGVGPSDLPRLQVVALGGELMPQHIVDTWAASVRLLNVYGVTECAVYQAYGLLRLRDVPRQLTAAFPGGTVITLAAGDGDDPSAQVQESSGAHGELWISGPQVGLGYIGRPELTAERFHEFASLGRCFRTGDIAAAASSGGWTLLGRRDTMVKLRGRRVELGEIEEVLLAGAPELLHAVAVVLVRDPQPRLAAWLVPSGGADAGQGQGCAAAEEHGAREIALCSLLRYICQEQLPQYMVPAVFATAAALPTTGTGKLARRELAKWPLPASDVRLKPLNTETEHSVAAAWTQVLGVPVRDGAAHFLELGGDSLAALRICQQLAASLPWKSDSESLSKGGGEFGELLPEPLLPASLLKRPRLADFAQQLEERLGLAVGENVGEEASSRVTADDANVENAAGADLVAPDIEVTDSLDTTSVQPGNSILDIFYHAAGVGVSDVVKHILDRGLQADGCLKASAGARTPLHAACANGHVSVVRLLLAARASASAADGHGLRPVHLAMKGNSADALLALLEARASLHATDSDRQTAMHHAARSGAPLRVLEKLLDLSEPRFSGKFGKASNRAGRPTVGSTGCSGFLDQQDRWNRTALHWAVVNGHRTVVVWLLDSGASRTLRDTAGETPVAIAERRAQCRAQDRPDGLGASVFGDIATLLGGSAATAKLSLSQQS